MKTIIWGTRAGISYNEELDFIHAKWNLEEVKKFIVLVDGHLETLKAGTVVGKFLRKQEYEV